MGRHVADHEEQVASAKAATLIESLPWLRHFDGKIMVVKFGGNAMVDEALGRTFAEDMVFLRQVGVKPVVVHGGGPQISAALAERGIPSEFRGGLRFTNTQAIDVVREVLAEQVGPELARLIDAHGPLAQALSGETDGLFTATKRGTTVDGEEVDLGFVGDVTAVNPAVVRAIIDAGRIPVVSSIAPDVDGQALNVNADSAAAALAVALGAEKLIVLTDVAGLYRDWPDTSSLVSEITADELRELLPTLESGMIPKMAACLEAVDGGVPAAAIIDGRLPHAILLEAFTSEGSGTQVVPAATATEES
jgi:acetylglutamate kinase